MESWQSYSDVCIHLNEIWLSYFSVDILAMRIVANRGLLYRPVQSLKQIFKTYDVNLSCETSHQEKNT